ncbi:hypothetical protein [Microcoleus sp. T3_A4]|uniref:hypothetical protein n=1 Tax=Microcoleus sp. T3_A4 TaxID=2818968 RepID=UPI002FD3C4BA
MGALNSFYNVERALTNDRQLSGDHHWNNMLYFSTKFSLFQVHQIPTSSLSDRPSYFWEIHLMVTLSRIASPLVERLSAPGSSDGQKA